MPIEHQQSLKWSAFRYVCGDMSAKEAQTFESRLADDQAAREAVCEAVSLGQQVAATRPESYKLPAWKPPRRWKHIAAVSGWVLAGAAAAILAMVLIGFRLPAKDASGPLQVVGPHPNSAPRLPADSTADALVWVKMRTAVNRQNQTQPLFQPPAVAQPQDIDAVPNASIPDWVFAAAGTTTKGKRP